MAFSGWPEEALDFYDGLVADNTKTYWTAHKAVYTDQVPLGRVSPVEQRLIEMCKGDTLSLCPHAPGLSRLLCIPAGRSRDDGVRRVAGRGP